jgi:hypothetical protein
MSLLTEDVFVVTGHERKRLRDRGLSTALRRGFELEKRISKLEAELSVLRGLMARRAHNVLRGQKGSVSFQTGRLTLRVSSRQETVVLEENVRELRRLLGRRFKELVRVKKIYTGSAKLVNGADREISRLIHVRQLSPRFNWHRK